MGLNDTVSAQRVHIGFFGKRNAGKSSVVNAFTSQKTALVSEIKGTTTDPVYKSMELLPIGPVMIVDTAGYDDSGELGRLRVEKTVSVLEKIDIAVLVIDAALGAGKEDSDFLHIFEERKLPHIVVYNKSDLLESIPEAKENEIYVSAKTAYGIEALKNKVAALKPQGDAEKRIVADLLEEGDTVVLVVPIDKAAPKGRLILPQQQTIRDILDSGAVAVVARDTELEKTLEMLSGKPKLVITDSQVFGKVARIVPDDTLLTSFSVLFARYKGELWELADGAEKIEKLKDGDTVLISEGCTHHRQCGDIGTQKLPKMLSDYTKKRLSFEFTSGTDFPKKLQKYALIVHCGGCMLTEKDMKNRMEYAKSEGVPVTNYGTAIAYVNGILKRAMKPFNKK